MTKDPNKNRNEKDFKKQIAIMIECAEIMKKYGLPPILYGGVVLGMIRDGDFIPWDFDCDFFVDISQAMGKEQDIYNEFKKLDYIKLHIRSGAEDWKVSGEKYDYHFDLHGFYRKDDIYYSKVKRSNGNYALYRLPATYIDHLQEREFRGYKFLIPQDTNGFFDFMYVNWRVPMRSVKHKEYLNKRFKKELK